MIRLSSFDVDMANIASRPVDDFRLRKIIHDSRVRSVMVQRFQGARHKETYSRMYELSKGKALQL